MPYKFTAKELDKETGLYYYGARYLDPKYSRWISTDPALGEYIPQAPTDEEAKRHNQNLPGMGGVFNTVNASLYHYAGNNPIKYTDLDGCFINAIIGAACSFIHRVGANSIAIWAAQNGTFPKEAAGFSFDSETNLYHATFDCWQGSLFDGYIGYNNLYDMVFDIGTDMQKVRFDFSSGGNDYTLWAWKGDYLNLGAGCELGIYEKASGILGALGHFVVNKDLAMNMTATLTLNGRQIGSFNDFHWWATSFNPFEQGVNAKDLTAQFTVNFGDNKQMYSDFKNTWNIADSPWSFNDELNISTLEF